MTEQKQISLQKDDTQAALESLARLEDILDEAYIGTEVTKIRAALTAQLTKTDDNVSCPNIANTVDINAELLEAATKLDAELNRRNSYDCQLKTSQVLSDSWPAIKRAIARAEQKGGV